MSNGAGRRLYLGPAPRTNTAHEHWLREYGPQLRAWGDALRREVIVVWESKGKPWGLV